MKKLIILFAFVCGLNAFAGDKAEQKPKTKVKTEQASGITVKSIAIPAVAAVAGLNAYKSYNLDQMGFQNRSIKGAAAGAAVFILNEVRKSDKLKLYKKEIKTGAGILAFWGIAGAGSYKLYQLYQANPEKVKSMLIKLGIGSGAAFVAFLLNEARKNENVQLLVWFALKEIGTKVKNLSNSFRRTFFQTEADIEQMIDQRYASYVRARQERREEERGLR